MKIIIRQINLPNAYEHGLMSRLNCLKVLNENGKQVGEVTNIKNLLLTGIPIELTININNKQKEKKDGC